LHHVREYTIILEFSKFGGFVEADFRERLDDILLQFSRDRENLIPILQEVQQEFGYLPEEAMQKIADFLRLSNSTVYSVGTFYTQFKMTPSGKRVVRVCRGTACHVRGGARVLREVQKRLGIKPGETTEDWEYTLETAACFGSCALAPVVVVGQDVYGRMTTTKIEQILPDSKS
jgi:NADH-quinone oxidoreductase subunit E